MKKTLRYLRPLASIAGLALFAYVLRQEGMATILDGARALGAGFVLLILLSGLRHALRTAAWHVSIEPGTPRPGLLDLFGLRLMGEGLNGVTPAGPLLGESVKVWAASRYVPAFSCASSVVIENLIYGLGVGLFLLSGGVLLLAATSPRAHLESWTVVACLVASLFVLYAILRRRGLLIAPLLDRLPVASRGKRLLGPYELRIKAVESEVHGFFLTRRAAFIGILGLEFLTNFTGVAEAYLILRVTTLHASLLAAYLVEIANRAVQLFFAFVPFGLGVEEGAAAGTLKALGYGASQGVLLAILRRARTVVWAALGLLLLAGRYCVARPVEDAEPIETPSLLKTRSRLKEGAQRETAHCECG
jgi:uncharacterized membrane protein YbhN (UPF0104 family)